MQVTDIPVSKLREAPWNANQIDEAMLARLRQSIRRFGLVQNLVVRRLPDGSFEVLSGNQRLIVIKEAALGSAPCVVTNLDDAHARILAEALNRVQGQDDLGLRSELVAKALEGMSEQDVLAILPETSASLKGLAAMGQESLAEHLQKWQQAQAARLRHLQFQLTAAQLEVVEKALAAAPPQAARSFATTPIPGVMPYICSASHISRRRSAMNNDVPGCPVCGQHLLVKLARGRKSGKAFVMLVCPVDGRHFRGFITDRVYVGHVLDGLETAQESLNDSGKSGGK